MFFLRRRIFPCGNESALGRRWRRVLLGDNRRREGHTAADQVPVCWSAEFNWTPIYIYIYIYICVCVCVYLTICALFSYLCRIRLALEIAERNYWVRRGGSYIAHSRYIREMRNAYQIEEKFLPWRWGGQILVAVYRTKRHSFLNTFVSDSLTHEIRPVLQPSLHIVNVMRQDNFSCTRAWKQFPLTVLSEPVITSSSGNLAVSDWYKLPT